MQSLFSQKEHSLNPLDLNISQIEKEISDYFKKVKKFNKFGFEFSIEENKVMNVHHDIAFLSILVCSINALLYALLPGNALVKTALLIGLTTSMIYRHFSKKLLTKKQTISYLKKQTDTLKVLLKNDNFKVNLIVNIEKQFNALEEKFKNHPEAVSLINNKRLDIINELKTILIEENLHKLKSLSILLTEIKKMEQTAEKISKINNINYQVNKILTQQKTETLENNDMSDKIKRLL